VERREVGRRKGGERGARAIKRKRKPQEIV